MAKREPKKEVLTEQEVLIKDLQAQVHDLYQFCVEWRKQNDALKVENTNLHYQIVRLGGIVQYLENKIEADTIRS
jgi:hypothetical protein